MFLKSKLQLQLPIVLRQMNNKKTAHQKHPTKTRKQIIVKFNQKKAINLHKKNLNYNAKVTFMNYNMEILNNYFSL